MDKTRREGADLSEGEAELGEAGARTALFGLRSVGLAKASRDS
jgi:hypothetical protein